eukprot:gnl/Spiro4/5465_TR2769_c1_g1_i2.p2 gnl/Spiro4/5465_TR2769_c1_g1~~gnl/Spiro4/5465_TR2769_c1_g1_i2.p2  ORF type:complete len:144 (-),score=7.68 gnl/Spiro4/5465_TR2769_c1_g1_i2:1060-1491(-)
MARSRKLTFNGIRRLLGEGEDPLPREFLMSYDHKTKELKEMDHEGHPAENDFIAAQKVKPHLIGVWLKKPSPGKTDFHVEAERGELAQEALRATLNHHDVHASDLPFATKVVLHNPTDYRRRAYTLHDFLTHPEEPKHYWDES